MQNKGTSEAVARIFGEVLWREKDLRNTRPKDLVGDVHLDLDDGDCPVAIDISSSKGVVEHISTSADLDDYDSEVVITLGSDGLYTLTLARSERETDLATYDPASGTARFPKGIGGKRQARAINLLKVLEDRLAAMREQYPST